MLKRKIESDLVQWKKSANRKTLVIKGIYRKKDKIVNITFELLFLCSRNNPTIAWNAL